MKVKITRSTLLFYLAYVMWISINILKVTHYRELYTMQVLFKVLNIPIYSMLFFKLVSDNRYSLKTIIGAFIFILTVIVYINSESRVILDMMLFIYSSKNVPFRDIVKVTINVQIILMIIIILSSFAGIIKNDIWYRDDGNVRYGLGYTYCTFSANFFYHIILMYVYLKDNTKIKITAVLFILSINEVIYMLTDTKAVYYLIILLVICMYILNYYKINIKKNIFNKIVFKYCFVISGIVSIVFSINYDSSNKVYKILNTLLTGRLELGKIAYDEYGIPLLGQTIEWVTGRPGVERSYDSVYRYVDSSYLNVAINYGIIIIILICIGFTIAMKKMIDNNNINGCIALLFLAIHSISDPQLLQMYYHPFLFIFGYLFYEKYKYIKIVY